jgi:hypothetical protein
LLLLGKSYKHFGIPKVSIIIENVYKF